MSVDEINASVVSLGNYNQQLLNDDLAISKGIFTKELALVDHTKDYASAWDKKADVLLDKNSMLDNLATKVHLKGELNLLETQLKFQVEKEGIPTEDTINKYNETVNNLISSNGGNLTQNERQQFVEQSRATFEKLQLQHDRQKNYNKLITIYSTKQNPQNIKDAHDMINGVEDKSVKNLAQAVFGSKTENSMSYTAELNTVVRLIMNNPNSNPASLIKEVSDNGNLRTDVKEKLLSQYALADKFLDLEGSSSQVRKSNAIPLLTMMSGSLSPRSMSDLIGHVDLGADPNQAVAIKDLATVSREAGGEYERNLYKLANKDGGVNFSYIHLSSLGYDIQPANATLTDEEVATSDVLTQQVNKVVNDFDRRNLVPDLLSRVFDSSGKLKNGFFSMFTSGGATPTSLNGLGASLNAYNVATQSFKNLDYRLKPIFQVANQTALFNSISSNPDVVKALMQHNYKLKEISAPLTTDINKVSLSDDVQQKQLRLLATEFNNNGFLGVTTFNTMAENVKVENFAQLVTMIQHGATQNGFNNVSVQTDSRNKKLRVSYIRDGTTYSDTIIVDKKEGQDLINEIIKNPFSTEANKARFNYMNKYGSQS